MEDDRLETAHYLGVHGRPKNPDRNPCDFFLFLAHVWWYWTEPHPNSELAAVGGEYTAQNHLAFMRSWSRAGRYRVCVKCGDVEHFSHLVSHLDKEIWIPLMRIERVREDGWGAVHKRRVAPSYVLRWREDQLAIARVRMQCQSGRK